MASGPLRSFDGRENQRKNQSKIRNVNHLPKQSSQSPIVDNENCSPNHYRLSTSDAPADSDESSSQNRSMEQHKADNFPGYTRSGDWVRISLSSRSKIGVKELKKKLKNELDQVRSLAKKLESKDFQLSGYVGGSGYSQSQFSTNNVVENVKKVSSEVGSAEMPDSRPFQSVPISGNDKEGGKSVEKEKKMLKNNKNDRNSELVSRKEKFKDGEANGCKRSGAQTGKNHGPFKSCRNLLEQLMKHKFGWVFNVPVDAKGLGLHDYHKIVKEPMDFGTVKTRLNKNWYKSPKEFAEDVRLTFSNAMLYNPKGQDVHFMAEQLSKIFEAKWRDIEADYNRNRRLRMDDSEVMPTPTSRNDPTSVDPQTEMRTIGRPESMKKPPPQSKEGALGGSETMSEPTDTKLLMPVSMKPKAKDPHKRDMTFEEKQRLSKSLQNLPSEKLDNIVKIIKKRNQGLYQNDDEIEVDIASVDPETLWELDRFVTNYKKSLSKNKRKAEVAGLSREESILANQETNPAGTIARKQKDSNADSESDNSSACGSDASHSPSA